MPVGPKSKKPEPQTEEKPDYVDFSDVFPRSEGPPPVANYEGKKLLAPSKQTITVELDAGAFRAVWEMVEARAKQQWAARNVLPSAGAYVRAVKALREAWHRTDAQTPGPTSEGESQEPAA